MFLTAYCPQCGQKHNCRGQSLGTILHCRNCGRKFKLTDRLPASSRLWRLICASFVLLCLCVGVFRYLSRPPSEAPDVAARRPVDGDQSGSRTWSTAAGAEPGGVERTPGGVPPLTGAGLVAGASTTPAGVIRVGPVHNPSLISTETLLEAALATARSGRPSPLKSPTATAAGAVPTAKFTAGWKLPWPLPRSRLTLPFGRALQEKRQLEEAIAEYRSGSIARTVTLPTRSLGNCSRNQASTRFAARRASQGSLA
jgi:hypothetical protein